MADFSIKFRWVLGTLLLTNGLVGPLGSAEANSNQAPDSLTAKQGCTAPLYEQGQSGTSRYVAFHPFYYHLETPAQDFERSDLLWPLATWTRMRNEKLFQALFVVRNQTFSARENGRYRTWVMPFYFQGRDKAERNYCAIFPLGGRIREFAGRDEITFLLFPLFINSRVNDVRSTSWLWPLFSRTEGDGISRLRALPFYARSEKSGSFVKRSLLWPIWHSAEYTDPERSGRAWILFPFAGHSRVASESTLWILPPFFRFSKGAGQKLSYFPWPFLQSASGRIEKRYLWPLWGRKQTPAEREEFFLWPLVKHRSSDGSVGSECSLRVLPFYWSRTHSSKTDSGARSCLEKQRAIWPLFSWRSKNDSHSLRILNLWPLAADGPLNRNYAPLWTLYKTRSDNNSFERELLWGFYHQSKSSQGESRLSIFPLFERESSNGVEKVVEWSLLKGLLGCRKTDKGVSWRLLYLFEFGDKGAENSDA